MRDWILCLLLAAAILIALGDHARAERVLLIGDSLSLPCCGSMVPDSPGTPYALQLAQTLHQHDWTNVAKSSTGVGDWQPGDALWNARADPALQAGIDTVYILLGSIDANRSRTAVQYRADLERMIAETWLWNVSRVLLAFNPDWPEAGSQQALLDQYAPAMEAVCATDPRIICGPDMRTLDWPDDYDPDNPAQCGPWSCGYLHPASGGHSKMYAEVAPYFRPASVPSLSPGALGVLVCVLLICVILRSSLVGQTPDRCRGSDRKHHP